MILDVNKYNGGQLVGGFHIQQEGTLGQGKNCMEEPKKIKNCCEVQLNDYECNLCTISSKLTTDGLLGKVFNIHILIRCQFLQHWFYFRLETAVKRKLNE